MVNEALESVYVAKLIENGTPTPLQVPLIITKHSRHVLIITLQAQPALSTFSGGMF